MARTLYRIYLYLVAIVMLGFGGFALGSLLNTLLLNTPLRASYESAPTGTALVQTITLAVIFLVVALALGGLHYWLIRRDIAEDASAARGVVRALMLNLAQAIAAGIALMTGLNTLNSLTRGDRYSGLAGIMAFWLVTTIIFVLLQLERGRTQAAEGPARTLERLHLYALQILALAAGMIGAWITTASDSITGFFRLAGAIPDPCTDTASRFYIYPYGGPGGPFEPVRQVCAFPQALTGEWLSVLWVGLVLVTYIWLARNDPPRVLRVLAHALGFVTGAIVAIIGIFIGVNFALRGAFGAEQLSAQLFVDRYDFIPLLLFGAVVLWWYRRQFATEAVASPLGQQGAGLTLQAIGTVALGVPFYIGVTRVLSNLFELVVADGRVADPGRWAGDVALLIAGIAYPAVALLLRRNTTETAPIGPRRTVVLAGLAAGALAGAIGLAVALYLVVTAALGSALGGNWQADARLAFAVMLVGAFLTGLNIYRLRTDRGPEAPAVPRPAPAAPASTIEGVLDDLLAARITRAQAVQTLRAMGVREKVGV